MGPVPREGPDVLGLHMAQHVAVATGDNNAEKCLARGIPTIFDGHNLQSAVIEVQSQRTLVRFETRGRFHAYKPFTHDLAPRLKYKARHEAKRSSSRWQESHEEKRTPHEPPRHGLARICGCRLIRPPKIAPV